MMTRAIFCILTLIDITSYVHTRAVSAKDDICDRYPSLSMCVGTATNKQPETPEVKPQPPSQPPPFEEQTLEIITYCSTYKAQYSYFCSTNGEISNTQTFCPSYRKHCVDPSPTVTAPPLTGQEQLEYCKQNDFQYKYNCQNGPLANSPYQEFCNTFNHNCASLPQNALANYLNTNNSEQVRTICYQYQYMGDTYCPGYETVQFRLYCNYYRVYCQGKKPFPNIDGNIGLVAQNWGVAGIPFYPFNPSGTVAGGTRADVGFGDWGADIGVRKGVTDFYEQSDQFDANWQRGTIGGGSSWNVPVVGIGGWSRTGAQLGGIVNFGDFPSLLAGGVPVGGPPLSGLSQIPLMQGQPAGPGPFGAPYPAVPPIGGGGLGKIGAIMNGANYGSGTGFLGNMGLG